MNFSIKAFFKNFSYSLSSNLISMIISTLIIALVPKMVGVTEFGYYQLYIFYASYVGFFHFGWCDGIYLKYGGTEYEKYDKPLMSSQFWLLLIFEFSVSSILSIIILNCPFDSNKNLIFFMVIISLLLVIPKTLLIYLLQISNRIKHYAICLIIEKVVYFILTLLFLFLDFDSFEILIIADLLGKVSSLFISIYYCKDIVFSKPIFSKKSFNEALDNLNVGIKLLVANIAGMLILGIIRVAIENQWSIETYGKISLAINISNMVLIFINAIGIVVFPILKRLNIDKIKNVYHNVQDVLMLFLFATFLAYVPIRTILLYWLPNYADSLEYLAILYPLCIYESKMSLLVNTYLKVLRKERYLLLVNVMIVLLSSLLTYFSVFVLENIYLTMFCIFFLFALRCILCEFILGKSMSLSFAKNIFSEFIMCIIFIVCNLLLSNLYSFIVYTIVYLTYLYINKQSILHIKKFLLDVVQK